MVLRMKNFDIFGVHWKIRLLRGGGGDQKNQYIEGIAKNVGAWTVCWFKEGRVASQERAGGAFEGGLIPSWPLCWAGLNMTW